MQDNKYRPQGVDVQVAKYGQSKCPIYVQDPEVRLFATFNLSPRRVSAMCIPQSVPLCTWWFSNLSCCCYTAAIRSAVAAIALAAPT